MRLRLVLTLAIGLVTGCGPATTAPVEVPPGVSTRMTPDEVSRLVFASIREMEREAGRAVTPPGIVSIRVEAWPTDGLVWIVRANGTFAASRPAPGMGAEVASSGTFVISDATGSIVEFGFP